MDNITAVINRKVWNFIEDASEQACAEYGVDEKEVWSDGKRFGYLQEFADHLIHEGLQNLPENPFLLFLLNFYLTVLLSPVFPALCEAYRSVFQDRQ